MSASVMRRLVSVSLFVALAGCSTLGIGGDKQPATQVVVAPDATAAAAGTPAVAPPPGQAYVAGKCPQVVIRDEGAIWKSYAGGAKDDPQKLMYQASLAQGTRQCTTDGTDIGITVAVQGRLVAGPMGGSGTVNLPIRVSVMDGDKTLYSEVTNYQVVIPAGESTTQFVFNDSKAHTVGGSGGFVNVYVGFDQGAPKGAKTTKAGSHKKK